MFWASSIFGQRWYVLFDLGWRCICYLVLCNDDIFYRSIVFVIDPLPWFMMCPMVFPNIALRKIAYRKQLCAMHMCKEWKVAENLKDPFQIYSHMSTCLCIILVINDIWQIMFLTYFEHIFMFDIWSHIYNLLTY